MPPCRKVWARGARKGSMKGGAVVQKGAVWNPEADGRRLHGKALRGRPKPPSAVVFGDQPGEAGDAGFSMPGSGFAQGALRIPVAGEGALADKILRAAVGKAFREDFEFTPSALHIFAKL